ncbi:MAG: tetratricopeptide repeat protein, partial [Gemmatimonadetes bacterium]|nr:tetratricopeptide repeat protein [Gemmatimonadota bacterium]
MIDLEHLRRRKLVQWAVAYLAGAWLILQLLDLIGDNYPAAAGAPRIALPLLAVGFLAALVVAWYHGEKGSQRVGGMEIMMLAGILVIAGAAVGFLARGNRGAGNGTGAAQPDAAPAGVATEQNSIAVLPFVNMSGDEKQEYFADGLTEELLNVLAQLPELRVASRTSAFAFKGQEIGIDSIARALRVAHVREASVRQAGQRVKITAQLIDAKSGYHLWSDTYERDYQDIFAIQEEISRAIVDALKLRLAAGSADSALSVPETADPEAHRLVLEGMASLRLQNQASLRHALDCFRQALARDPDYLPAREQLARGIFNSAYRGMVPADQGYAEARREAERVLAVDPGNASAHVTLGQISNLYDWDVATAQEHFRQALARNPNSADAHGALGDVLVRLGQPERGMAEARRAAEIDPLSAPTQNRLGAIGIYTRNYEAGIAALRTALALTPDASTGR